MENENLDLDVKPAGNKDLWLFLIIIDIVLLCVFGFFIYTHFAADLFRASTPPQQAVEEVASESQPLPQETVVVEAAPAEVVPPPVAPAVQPEEISVTQMLAAQAQADKAAAQKADAKVTSAQKTSQEEPAKESILVEKNAKSKYRQVTFRWYGEGEKVAVVSGFTNRKPQALTKKADYWEITLSIAPGTYKFLYVVDGKNRRDPYAKEQDGRSVVVIE